MARGVLVTRPEPGAAETAARVAALGFRPVLAPALVLAPRPVAPHPPVQAILLPSRAAARALAPSPTPVLAVGEATGEEARARGFAQVAVAGGDAADLLRRARATLDPAGGPLLLACGRGYSHALAASLRGAGFRVIRRAVYAAAEAESLPPEAVESLRVGNVCRALFFSPRSARCILRLLEQDGLGEAARGIVALALSPRVAAELKPLPWREVRVSPRPHQDPMLELLDPP